MDSFDPAIVDAPTIAGSNSQDSAWRFPGSGESALHGGAKLIFKTFLSSPPSSGLFFAAKLSNRISPGNWLPADYDAGDLLSSVANIY
jgi:hypothetical protein